MENHVAFVHEEKKSVGCQICRMKFKKLTVLNKHIESEHLSENSQGVFENPDDLFDDTDDFFDDTEELYELDDRSEDEDDITTFSFNEDHGNWGEYLDLKPVIADGKTNRGYWVRNMYPRYLFIILFSSYE